MLRLLDDVTYDGRRIAGERSQALLAALAAAGGRAVGEAALAVAVWGPDDQPASPGKALQVVVSRTRNQTAPEVVLRVEHGYRLGSVEVDAALQASRVSAAVAAEHRGDLTAARNSARAAVDQAVADDDAPPALEELRAAARSRLGLAREVLGRALAALGEHRKALELLLTCAAPDESTLAALLRSEAAVHGAPEALARYEQHRVDLRDRLGVDPGPTLASVHAELLAADNPVRTGLRYDATSLVGRDDDLRRLRALVRESRVTSILGPGGLGKTRLAHLLGREAEQSVVHFVELVGVASPDDVVGEIGSALGVRDSVSGRRVLTAEQRADVRGRIAQQLDRSPTLLILDNCEHVVEAVADLVATVVATTRDLRVVTTTRAPLAISAERIFSLDQLDDDESADLFRQRATAARPGVALDDDAVRRVVARLDGLPLAVELAAARVRAMSVEDVARRLDDRFGLLRSTDRAAPDRHQTLLAVIDWSWNLLDETDQRALARLALFHDGFTLEAAEAVVGSTALSSVESLTGQSLLAVREARRGIRYRMLETVREFGRRRLDDTGDATAARTVVRAWGVALAREAAMELYSDRQVEVVRGIADEENNLADLLRESLADADPEAAIVLVAALGGCWTIRGEHPRIISLADAVDELLEGWEPPDHLVELTARAASVLVMNTAVAELPTPVRARELLDRLAERSSDPGTRALQRILAALGDREFSASPAALDGLADDPDRQVAMLALQWSSHALENAGDVEGAVVAAERGHDLWRTEDGVWSRALLNTHLAGLHAQQGRLDVARRYAEAGLAVLDALEAHDDAVQLRAVLATAAMQDGDLEGAQHLLDEMSAQPVAGMFGGAMVIGPTRAELALARGEVAEGFALYDRAVEQVQHLRFPGIALEVGYEPWTMYAESASLAARAWHGDGDGGDRLNAGLARRMPRFLSPDRPSLDYPVVGCLLFALGLWRLRRESADALAIDLLVLADRFGYNRYVPSLTWDRAVSSAEEALPGALSAALATYGDRRGRAVLEEARAAAHRLLADPSLDPDSGRRPVA